MATQLLESVGKASCRQRQTCVSTGGLLSSRAHALKLPRSARIFSPPHPRILSSGRAQKNSSYKHNPRIVPDPWLLVASRLLLGAFSADIFFRLTHLLLPLPLLVVRDEGGREVGHPVAVGRGNRDGLAKAQPLLCFSHTFKRCQEARGTGVGVHGVALIVFVLSRCSSRIYLFVKSWVTQGE